MDEKLKKDRLKQIWYKMHSRCYREADRAYRWYGAKGITICDEWHTFNNFYEWALNNGYKIGLTCDRIKNYLGYEPSNCRWITRAENTRNITRILIEINGDVYTINELAKKMNINSYHIRNWMSRNKLHERLLESDAIYYE